jgi:hypothetical protein
MESAEKRQRLDPNRVLRKCRFCNFSSVQQGVTMHENRYHSEEEETAVVVASTEDVVVVDLDEEEVEVVEDEGDVMEDEDHVIEFVSDEEHNEPEDTCSIFLKEEKL